MKKAIDNSAEKHLGKKYRHIKLVRKRKNRKKEDNVYKPFDIQYISPHKVQYVTPVTKYVDHERYKDQGLYSPHSGIGQNRGWFNKKRIGLVLPKDWDLKSLKFNDLNEYVSLYQFLVQDIKWEDTIFAQRTIKWLEMGNQSRAFDNVNDYLKKQPKRIKNLVRSIEKKGVLRVSSSVYDVKVLDEIRVNIGRDGEYFHNNYGYHRLSIAKILDIDKIPVLVNTRYHCN
ncbi:MAG: hypothetical protein JJU28_19590 [Cyclobacteriaceae bacterium]|nr:hypothetical protein [Cyclobacteriaceae bacterium]